MANWYCSSVDYAAVTQWAALTVTSLGTIRRQLTAPAQGSERCFVCTTAGTTGATEPTWVLTKAATTADGTVVWTECTGNQLYNGDTGGTAWGAPHANILAAGTAGWPVAGDTIFVRNTHNVTYAAAALLTMQANTCFYLCTNASTLPPTAGTITTGATEATSGANALTISSAGNIGYIQGFTFIAGSGANVSTLNIGVSGSTGFHYANCTFSLGGTTTGAFSTNSNFGNMRFKNCTFNFSSATQNFGSGATGFYGLWEGGSVTGTAPTTLFVAGVNRNMLARIRDVDLSIVSGTLISLNTGTNGNYIEFTNCKLNAAVTISSSTTVPAPFKDPQVRLINCDGGSTNYTYHMRISGMVVDQDTTTVRSGGASDETTAISWKAVSASNQSFLIQAFYDDIFVWNTLTGSARTVSVYLTTNSSLTNANCWMEVEYLGTSGSTLGSIVSTYPGILATATALTTDASTWSGTALTNKYVISTSITPQMVGLIRAKVFVTIPSATIYLDPKLVVT